MIRTGVIVAILILLYSCKSEKAKEPVIDTVDYHQKMVEKLQDLVNKGTPEQYYHWNLKRALKIVPQIPQVAGPANIKKRLEYGAELLNAGRAADAILNLEAIFNDYKLTADKLTEANKPLYDMLALAYLRLGEEENCLTAANAAACTVPIAKDNKYKIIAASEKAIQLLEQILNKFPDDNKSKWMLNLSYMTLGRYPDNVPGRYLIKLDIGKDASRFTDVARNAGVDYRGLSGGVIADDLDGDGDIDIFCTSYGMEDMPALYLNDGNGKFIDKTLEAGLEGLYGGLNCLQTDYNNDGLLDIFILRGAWFGEYGRHPNSLLENQGNGTFKDVTYKAGLSRAYPSQVAVWLDYDLDGWLDVFIGNEAGKQAFASELYHNNGDGTFTEVSKEAGAGLTGFVKGVSSIDIDNDGYPEIYASLLGGNNVLLKNEAGTYKNISSTTTIEKPYFSFPSIAWDVNQDGFQDLFVSSYDVDRLISLSSPYAAELLGQEIEVELPRMYINDQKGGFVESSVTMDIDKVCFTMGCNYGDIDNNGYPDMLLGTGAPHLNSVIPNRMFKNQKGENFKEVTFSAGVGHIQKGHGVSFADFDNDGDQDIYAVMGGAYEGDVFANALYLNEANNAGNYLKVKLVGITCNKAAIGARVELQVEHDQGEKSYFATVGSGGSFGANPLQLHMGIGLADKIKSIIINWPDKSAPEIIKLDLSANKAIKITQGKGKHTVI